jgi:hypothetical protein
MLDVGELAIGLAAAGRLDDRLLRTQLFSVCESNCVLSAAPA